MSNVHMLSPQKSTEHTKPVPSNSLLSFPSIQRCAGYSADSHVQKHTNTRQTCILRGKEASEKYTRRIQTPLNTSKRKSFFSSFKLFW